MQAAREHDRPIVIATATAPAASVTELHGVIRFDTYIDRKAAETALQEAPPQYQGPFGVLLFLYSVVATRGVDIIEGDQVRACVHRRMVRWVGVHWRTRVL